MSKLYIIRLILLSDTTFSRGDGVAGWLDREVEHDENGLPYLHGRTLKGLLGEEVDNLIDLLPTEQKKETSPWTQARQHLFGQSGSGADKEAKLHYGHAQLSEKIRQTVALSLQAKDNNGLTAQHILNSLTGVRRQTAVNGDGLPHDGSLRAMRVILRQTKFYAHIDCPAELTAEALALLAGGALALRHGGTGRNRGRGHLQVDLLDGETGQNLNGNHQLFLGALA